MADGPRLSRRDLLATLAAAAGGFACRRPPPSKASGARFESFPIARLDGFVTPAADFFVRDHFGIPPEASLPADRWRIEISGEVEQPLTLSLADLADLPKLDLPVTLECAGNGGRNGIGAPGGPRAWGGASTATFQGVSLDAVLARARPRSSTVEIVFEGADSGSERGSLDRQLFARSVPLAAARSPQALLATGMNGARLPVLHGGPLRVLFPGRYATDSVKWLRRIRAVSVPFDGFYQHRRYRKATDQDPEGQSLGELRVQCEITAPEPGDRLPGALLADVVGVAWGGRGGVARVEVSADGGQSFGVATFLDPPTTTAWRRWRWTFRPGHPGPRWIIARATDAGGNSQPLESDEELGISRSVSGPDRIQYANNSVPVVPVIVT